MGKIDLKGAASNKMKLLQKGGAKEKISSQPSMKSGAFGRPPKPAVSERKEEEADDEEMHLSGNRVF